jgi:hypothetical protein
VRKLPDFPTLESDFPTQQLRVPTKPQAGKLTPLPVSRFLTNSLLSDYKFLPHPDSEKSLIKQGNKPVSSAQLAPTESGRSFVVNLQPLEERNFPDTEKLLSQKPQSAVVISAFLELFELLEEYAPVWYTEELHGRAAAAVRILQDV